MERRGGPGDAAPKPKLTPTSSVSRGTLWLFWAGCLVTSAAALRLVLWYWPGAVPLDVTSGVWIALAKDCATGVLYRPVFGAAGYGGTRYMPLFFLVHAGLMRLGIDPVAAGLGLTVASAALFDLALYFTLRELGVRPSLALPLSVLGHATISVQLLSLATRCDLLAAALNLGSCALALRCARQGRRATWLLAVAALVAAFYTKFTTVSGMIAAIALLRARRGRRAALATAAALLAVLPAVFVVLYVASGGRIWSSFLSVGSGGVNVHYAVRFPLWFALAIVEDPFYLLIFLASVYYAVRETRRRRFGFALGYFWLTLLVTAPVFASPGTDNNHLIDLLGACILLLGHVAEHRAESARLALLLPAALGGLTLVSWVPGMVSIGSVITGMGRPERRTVASIADRAGSPDRILSENPVIPVLAGGRPFLSDPFSLHILAKNPDVRADFAARLVAGEFPVVVLVDVSGSDAPHVMAALRARGDRGVDRFYGDVRFTDDFLDLLDRYYFVATVEHPFVVFERRAPRQGA